VAGREIGGLWILFDDFGERFDARLSGDRGSVSISLSTTSLAADNSCLALLSASAMTIDYVAIATAGKRVGELERKVSFGPAIKLTHSIAITEIIAEVPPRFQRHVLPPNRRVVGIPPATFEALLDAVVALGAITEEGIHGLNSLIESRRTRRRERLPDMIAFERDAVAISLETFRGSDLRNLYLSASPAAADAPFIKALERSGANVLEDRMVDHDLASFPGSSALRRNMVGAVTISTETGELTIVNANRTKIEKTLGVDLIYYHHDFRSFVMVQYKRMTGSSSPVYRPSGDPSYVAEIHRMKQFIKPQSESPESNHKPSDMNAFRLAPNPFFFKLCASEQHQHWSRMLPGMYIPLDLWEKLLASESSLGPKGGLALGYENVRRRLNNQSCPKQHLS
jgi:hypothetical protein